ncbi:MAG: M20/M25/M40 family metallo-hydrolase [Pseudomonadota bacterium]
MAKYCSQILLCCYVVLFSAVSTAEDALEAKIVAAVEQNMPLALQELEQSVNINSGTLNFAGVEQVGKFFQQHFDELGFDTEWQDGSAFDRAGHLVATHLAQDPNAPKLLLIGHLDTVFAKDDTFQSFKRIDDRYVAGPGITDMKGGNVIMVAALRALKANGLLKHVSIKVVLTGDEERSGKPLAVSKKALIDAAIWADISLGFEDGDSNIKTAVIARRGAIDWELNVTGRPAHSSQIFQPEVGYGAIFETARILNAFREQLAGYGNLTFNPGIIVGGTSIEHKPEDASANSFGKNNVVAKTSKVTGGIRASTPGELAHAQQVMQKIVSENLEHTSAVLTFSEGYPPMAPTDANRALLKQYSEVSEALGYGPVAPVNPRNAGAADISFTAEHVDMALDGLGLMGSGGHTRDEIADMTSLAKNAQKAAVLIYRLSSPE